MAVLVILAIASLYSWPVILGKISHFRKATSQSRHFIRAFRKASRLQEIATLAAECKASPLAQVFEDVYETYKRQTGGSGPPRNLTPSGALGADRGQRGRHHSGTAHDLAGHHRLHHRFVGLFGTVMGIIDAFHGLGTAGSATLRAVAPGISEALITTAAGLFVAIPALDRLQPVHRPHSRLCLRHRRLLPRTAELARRDSGSRCRRPLPRPDATRWRRALNPPREAVERGLYK